MTTRSDSRSRWFLFGRFVRLRRDLIVLFAMVAVALALRVAYVERVSIDTPIRADAYEYVNYAQNLVDHKTFSMEASAEAPRPDAFRSPGLPALIAIAMLIGGDEGYYDIVLGTQAAMGALLVVLTFSIARRFLPRWAVYSAMGLVALCPHLVSMHAYLLTETLSGFWLLASLASLLAAFRRRRLPLFAASGACFGLAYLTNPTVFFLPWILSIVLGWPWLRPKDTAKPQHRKELRGIAMLLTVFTLFWGGWSIRNAVSVPPDSPSALKRSVASMSHGAYPGFVHSDPRFKYYMYGDDPEQPAFGSSMGDFARILWKRVKQRPLRYLSWYLVEKPYYFWSWNILQGQGDIYVYPVHSSLYTQEPTVDATRRLMKLLHPWVLLLALAGIVGFRRLRRHFSGSREVSVLLVTILYSTLLHMVFASWPRYSIPLRPELYLWSVSVLVALLTLRTRLNLDLLKRWAKQAAGIPAFVDFIAVLFVAITARLSFLAFVLHDQQNLTHTADSAGYLKLASNLALNGFYSDQATRELGLLRTPGYPAFLALFRTLDLPDWSILVTQGLINALGVAVLLVLFRKLLSSRMLALACALAAALSPTALSLSALIMADGLFGTSVLVGFATLCLAIWRRSYGWIAVSSIVFCAAAYIKPTGFYWLPAACVVWLCVSMALRRVSPLRWKQLVLFAAIQLGLLGGWVVRNYVVEHSASFSLIGQQTTIDYLAVKADLMAEGRPDWEGDIPARQRRLRDERSAELREGVPLPVVLARQLRPAMETFRAHPGSTLKAYLSNINDQLRNSAGHFLPLQLASVDPSRRWTSRIARWDLDARWLACWWSLFGLVLVSVQRWVADSEAARQRLWLGGAFATVIVYFMALSGFTFWTGSRLHYPLDFALLGMVAVSWWPLMWLGGAALRVFGARRLVVVLTVLLALGVYIGSLDKEVAEKKIQTPELDRGKTASNALFDQAFAAQRAGRRDECIGLYERLLALAPRHRQGTFNLAYAYRYGDSAEDWNRSVALFQRVLEIDPGYSEAIHHLAAVYWKLERREEAIRYDRLYLEEGEHEDLKAASRRRLAGAGGGE